jgi:sugar/nucleoside kinase (ribokinase family)
MVITVIGHLCKDIVHLPSGEVTDTPKESFGGIIYSLFTLANLMGEKDIIQPVFGVGQADHESLLEILKDYKNIDTSGIFKFKGTTNQVHLFYQQDAQTRIECSKDISAPIPFSKIKSYLDGDGVLINMISGSDITLETLDTIRMEVREKGIPIHFDFHALTLGIDQEYKRFRRSLTDWRRWCFMLNSIQMSQEEAHGLTAEKLDEHNLINQLTALMVSTFLITRGKNGVSVIVQDEHKKLTRQDIAGTSFGDAVDTTGCGDVFGATYFYQQLKLKDNFQAADFANKVAALNATFTSALQLNTLQTQLEQAGISIPKPTNGKALNGVRNKGEEQK